MTGDQNGSQNEIESASGDLDFQKFYSTISSKCQTYRKAVEKDQQKKAALYSKLFEDFGQVDRVTDEIEDQKMQLQGTTETAAYGDAQQN